MKVTRTAQGHADQQAEGRKSSGSCQRLLRGDGLSEQKLDWLLPKDEKYPRAIDLQSVSIAKTYHRLPHIMELINMI